MYNEKHDISCILPIVLHDVSCYYIDRSREQAKADGSTERESKNARSEWERIREIEIAKGIDA